MGMFRFSDRSSRQFSRTALSRQRTPRHGAYVNVEHLEERLALAGGLITSPDGLHTAAVAKPGQTGTTSNLSIVVEDGKTVGGPFVSVSNLQFSPAGDHLAFIAQLSNTQFQVFEDGKAVGASNKKSPAGLTFSRDGKHIAFTIDNGTVQDTINNFLGVFLFDTETFSVSGTSVVEDGKLLPGTFLGVSPLQFSSSDHLFYAAENSGEVAGTFQTFEDGRPIGPRFAVTTPVQTSIEEGAFAIPASFVVSANGAHTAFIVAEGANVSEPGNTFLIIEDGKLVATEEHLVAVTSLALSATGDHLAFVARESSDTGSSFNQGFEDGRLVTSQQFGNITSLTFAKAGSNLAFVAFNANQTSAQVFLNGLPVAGGATFQNVSNLTFSPDGKHLAFVGLGLGTSATPARVFEDGQPVNGLAFGSVASLTFSAGDNLAFVGANATASAAQVFENGRAVANAQSFGSVAALSFSPDGTRLAFVAFNPGKTGARVFNTTAFAAGGQTFGSIGALVFSPAGNNLAFIAIAPGGTSASVFEDGTKIGGPFNSATNLQFSTDGSQLTYLVNGITVETFLVAPSVTASKAVLLAQATQIVVQGFGFSPTAVGNQITLSGGATGTVIAATDTQLTIGKLKNLRAGVLTVRVVSHGKSSGVPVQIATVEPVVTVSTAALQTNAKTLTIHGFGFDSSSAANNVVTFGNGVKGKVTAATATTLTVSNLSGLKIGSLAAAVTVDGKFTTGTAVVAEVVATG
jgi:dipeptidyl aminopeptidase/acylaminoacyl peptidase